MDRKIIILAIDDNITQLNEYKVILTPRYDLRVVKSASDAIVFLNKTRVDVILLDILMPHISGFEFLHDIRRIPSYLDVPIIIVSGNTGADFFEEARKSTAFDVLGKPVRPDALVQTIEKSMAKSK